MPNYEKRTENLTRRGYTVRRFAAAQQAGERGVHRLTLEMGQAASRNQHEIKALGKPGLEKTKTLAHEALGAVARHGAAHLLADGEAHAVDAQPVFGKINDDVAVDKTFSPLIEPAKVVVARQRDGLHGKNPFVAAPSFL